MKIGFKIFSAMRIVTLVEEEVPANFVPAAAVIREEQALSLLIGRKGFVDGRGLFLVKEWGSTS